MKAATKRLVLVMLFALAQASAAQTLASSVKTAFEQKARSTYVECGTLIDGLSGTPRKNVIVEVRGDKIDGFHDVRSKLRSGRTDGSEVIDLTEQTCLPGLIDTHTHVLEPNPTYPSDSSSAAALRILEYGFTTIRNLGTAGGRHSDVQMRDAINGGFAIGPRAQIAIADSLSPHFLWSRRRRRP